MGVVNLTKTLKGKIGWVSISPDHKRVITQAKTFKRLLLKLKKMSFYGRRDDEGSKREDGAYLVSSRLPRLRSGQAEWRDLIQ